MNILDARTIAKTKLKSHRVRSAITVIIAGLLFGVIVAIITISQGIFKSIASYSDIKLNGRAIVSIFPVSSVFYLEDHLGNKAFVSKVESAYKAQVAQQQALAKKYNIPYDDIAQPSPINISADTKNKTVSAKELSTPLVQRIAREHFKEQLAGKPFDINKTLAPYDNYTVREKLQAIMPKDGQLLIMKDGKEKMNNSKSNGTESVLDFIQIAKFDPSLSQPFISSQDYKLNKREIPAIIPYDAAEKLLKLKPLPNSATKADRRDRIKYVNDNAGKITASFCYRNLASSNLLEEAKSQAEEIKKNAKNKDYQKPSVIYNLPNDTSCGPVTIKSDTKTLDEKNFDTRLAAFQKAAGIEEPSPVQHKITIRAIGISSGPFGYDSYSTTSISSVVSSLLNYPPAGGAWLIPTDLLSQVPAQYRPDEIFKPQIAETIDSSSLDEGSYLVEFKDVADARSIIKSSDDKIYIDSFGSSIILVDEIKSVTKDALKWALLGISAIASIILFAIIGRTMSENRKESSVFRAIGAKKSDIAIIYGTFTLLFALRIACFAFIIGIGAAALVNYLFSDSATLGAQLAYATVDSKYVFRLLGFDFTQLALVALTIVGASIIASIIPILLGSRRNPINDMRDDG